MIGTLAASTPGVAQTVAVGHAATDRGQDGVLQNSNAAALTVGDRLKVTLFENPRPEPGRKNVLSNLIERPEISGEYVIQNDGKVFLPFVGDVLVAGQSHAEFARAVEASFSRLLGSPVKVTIQIVEREPIYVTGPVARPGTFRYVPGMTVLHALALAGGVDGTSTDQWRRLELSRERERVQKSKERLSRLLAFRDVLLAERDGNRPVASQPLFDLVGEPGASRLVASEEQLRSLELQRHVNEEATIASIDTASRNELRALRERMTQTEAYLKGKSDYVHILSTMRASGTVTEANFHLAQSELNTVRERWHEVRLTIAQLERKLLELHHQKTRIDFDEKIKREQQIKTIQGLITEERITQSTLRNLVLGSVDFPGAEEMANTATRFRIIRRTVSGLERLESTDISALETLWPGDVLQVGRAPAIAAGAMADADRRIDRMRSE
jgi:protein involved in polysaccharide export with SLBB domain